MAMVDNVTSLSRSGLSDWVIQRVTAIVLGLYIIFLFGYFVMHPQLDFTTWKALFSCNVFRIISFLAFFSLVLHTWVGIWTVLTDYIHGAYVRLFLQVLVILSLVGFLVWAINIIWGW